MKTTKVTVIALPDQKVLVANYRRNNFWEEAVVLNTETAFRADGSYRNSYRVMLDRKSNTGNYLFLTVNDTSLRKL